MLFDFSKKLNWLLLLLIVLVVVGIPGNASASVITRVLPLNTPNITVSSEPQNLGTIQIAEIQIASLTPLVNGEFPLKIAVELPAGSQYAYPPAPGDEKSYIDIPATAGLSPNGLKPADVKIDSTSTPHKMIINVITRSNFLNQAIINVRFDKPHSQVVVSSTGSKYEVAITQIRGVVDLTGAESMTIEDRVVNAYIGDAYVTAQAVNLPTLTPGIGRVPAEITLVENVPGALQASSKAISLTLPEGFTWNTVRIKQSGGFLPKDISFDPKKDIDLDESGRSRLWLDINHSSLDLPWPMDPQHTTKGDPGIIKIQGFFNVSPTAPEGQIIVNIGGTNQEINPQSIVVGYLTGSQGSSSNKPQESTFTIGEATFNLNGVDALMESAPYIKEGRTYLPVRYVAYALGVTDNGIMWNGDDQTVTLVKGNQEIKLAIGSTILMVNGRNAGYLDVAPEISNGLTMLPVGVVAEKLGGQVEWDPVTQEVKVIYSRNIV